MHTYYVGEQYGDRDKKGKPLNDGITAKVLLKELFK